jgi:hypothetical protein
MGIDNFALAPLIPHERTDQLSFFHRTGGLFQAAAGPLPSHGSDLTSWWRGASSQRRRWQRPVLAAEVPPDGTSKRGCGSSQRGNPTGGASTILQRDFLAGPC